MLIRLLPSIILFIIFAVTATEIQARSNRNFNRPDSIPEVVVQSPDSISFTKLDKEASVNMDAWKRHLEKKLQKVINKAARSGMKPGLYKINVRFIVEKNGSIETVEVLNDPGYGMAEAAIDIIRSGPKWTPGSINNKPVRSYHTQPIYFRIE